MKEIKANVTGLIVECLVQPGETVTMNQDVVMLESMKMYIPVQASVNGVVRTMKVKEGDVVHDGDVILELEERR
ncbi:MAG TPA: biotin/lipoyl-containing protein [Ktedonobacteraceae bacterium]|nr:biotin/lipoyl-containing protein [Ktedonobacteraceae bacterium]